MLSTMLQYTPYIMLGEYLIMLLCLLTSCYCFLQLLYNYCYVKISAIELTPSMVIYMVSEVVFGLGCLSYVLHLLIFWKPSDVIYNSYLLYYTGSIQTVALILSPIPVFFLGFDRFLAAVLLKKHTKTGKNLVTLATVITLLIFTGVAIPFHVRPSYPLYPTTNCRSFGCLGPTSAGQVYTILRYTCSSANVVIGICLARTIRKKISNQAVSSKNNKLVLRTVLMSIFLDFVPHMVTFLLYTIFDFNVPTYFGPYSLFFSAIQSCICSMIYYRTLKKQKNSQQNTANKSTTKGTGTANRATTGIVRIV